jgi:AraC-like DNA-binding protein
LWGINLLDNTLFDSMPTVVDAMYFKLGKTEKFLYPLHYHDGYSEFLLILEGEGTFEIDGTHYEGKCGSLLCYNRSIWHEEQSTSEKFHAIFIGFKGLRLRGMAPDFFLKPDQPAMIALRESFLPIKTLFLDIIQEYTSHTPESLTAANSYLAVLMVKLARIVHYESLPERRRKPSQEAVQVAKRYIEENYWTDISLDVLARLTHLNSYYFCHLFKQETGLSPVQYLIRYRIEVAKQYLMNTGQSVSDISELVGYKSETYFHNIFKKTTGMPPGQFRSTAKRHVRD